MARSTAQAAALKREQILDAAIRRFARLSYEDASLRAIAADVGVDVAHVHRSFGSKEMLLAEAVRATARAERFHANSPDDLVDRLCAVLFADQAMGDKDEVRPIDIIVHSLSSSDASSVLRETILTDFIESVSKTTSPPSTQRAALIAAFILGVGVLRDVLQIKPLVDGKSGAVEDLTTQALKVLAGGDLPARGDEQ
ncbi:TetR/AcrR family transcriptional regulator [Polymorphum gilvum]|uniref:Transcriptional regulator, TetR family n=1 Tax=Polymorphum gilvum (strain LMG 25793 / CGMCC 1.9160 / SL003B-26A1) TaxID=991905 RepID=F2J4W2_POLGS|nr:TetR/AcrR family transcriptional regulator [Polymorphum gilvum]ADZ69054.1 Transcriptional regulator, TetR family [Polymorphum gilvum SL003B-26A1]